jgi:hypothetical protein
MMETGSSWIVVVLWVCDSGRSPNEYVWKKMKFSKLLRVWKRLCLLLLLHYIILQFIIQSCRTSKHQIMNENMSVLSKKSLLANCHQLLFFIVLRPYEWARIAHSVRAGRSRNWIPVGSRFFTHIQTGPEAHPAFCTMGTKSFPGVKRQGRGADHPPPSIPLLPL